MRRGPAAMRISWAVAAVAALAWAVAASAGGDAPARPAIVWLSKPDGCMQCQACRAPSLEEVVAALAAEGIPVRRAALHHVPVCAACVVCASGRLHAVQVEATYADALERAGWSPMREPPSAGEGSRK